MTHHQHLCEEGEGVGGVGVELNVAPLIILQVGSSVNYLKLAK